MSCSATTHYLWCYNCSTVVASGSFQSVVGDVFHVHKSSVSRVIRQVAGALCHHFNQKVKFPSRPEQEVIQTSFFIFFPYVVMLLILLLFLDFINFKL